MSRALLTGLLALALAGAGCRRRKLEPPPPPPPQPSLPSSTTQPLPSPPATLPPPIETPKQLPPNPAGTLPQFPPAPPKPETRRPARAARPAPAKAPVEEEAKPDAQPPAPPPLLGEVLSPERRQELERAIEANLAEVDSAVEQIRRLRLDSRQSETLLRLRGLAENARAIRATEPTISAQLAARAAALARELLEVLKK